jgi:hypothetical protein
VNGPENTSQKSRVLGALLELNEILIQLREVLITFDQKLSDRFLIFLAQIVHDPLIPRNSARCQSFLHSSRVTRPSLLYRHIQKTRSDQQEDVAHMNQPH